MLPSLVMNINTELFLIEEIVIILRVSESFEAGLNGLLSETVLRI